MFFNLVNFKKKLKKKLFFLTELNSIIDYNFMILLFYLYYDIVFFFH